MRHLFSSFKKFDWLLFAIIVLLSILGLAVQYSLGIDSASKSFFYKQIFYLVGGLFIFFLVSAFDYRSLKNYSKVLYGLMMILLLITLVFGRTFNGTRGWLSIGILNLQAVELVKIILVIILAAYWARQRQEYITFKEIIQSGILVFVPFILVVLQPDVGSALILFGLWLGLLIFCDRRINHLALVILLIVVVIAVAWLGLLKDYQKDRIVSFVSPHYDPLGRGYQLTQSIIAVGSGELFGRGLGLGPQSQLHFLPASHTDFVFSVINEDLGFLGGGLIIFLYGLLFYKLFRLARSSYDNFSLLLIVGIALVLFIQLFINIGMNIGLMPITGVPLIFLSYGGSSLLATFIIFGILESIIMHRVKV